MDFVVKESFLFIRIKRLCIVKIGGDPALQLLKIALEGFSKEEGSHKRVRYTDRQIMHDVQKKWESGQSKIWENTHLMSFTRLLPKKNVKMLIARAPKTVISDQFQIPDPDFYYSSSLPVFVAQCAILVYFKCILSFWKSWKIKKVR